MRIAQSSLRCVMVNTRLTSGKMLFQHPAKTSMADCLHFYSLTVWLLREFYLISWALAFSCRTHENLWWLFLTRHCFFPSPIHRWRFLQVPWIISRGTLTISVFPEKNMPISSGDAFLTVSTMRTISWILLFFVPTLMERTTLEGFLLRVSKYYANLLSLFWW